jgi:hypothetical protein
MNVTLALRAIDRRWAPCSLEIASERLWERQVIGSELGRFSFHRIEWPVLFAIAKLAQLDPERCGCDR